MRPRLHRIVDRFVRAFAVAGVLSVFAGVGVAAAALTQLEQVQDCYNKVHANIKVVNGERVAEIWEWAGEPVYLVVPQSLVAKEGSLDLCIDTYLQHGIRAFSPRSASYAAYVEYFQNRPLQIDIRGAAGNASFSIVSNGNAAYVQAQIDSGALPPWIWDAAAYAQGHVFPLINCFPDADGDYDASCQPQAVELPFPLPPLPPS